MSQIKIDPDETFSLGDGNFVIEGDLPPQQRRLSNSNAFTLLKSEPYLRAYEDLASGFLPRSILELGIFQGGSYVFLDKLLKPCRMSAVDIGPHVVATVMHYLSRTKNRFVHFGTSQRDGEILRQMSSILWRTTHLTPMKIQKRSSNFFFHCCSPVASM